MPYEKYFQDRSDAGRQLAQKLVKYQGADTRVLGLPRGGIPVAFEIAKALRAPLEVFVARKLGAPYNPELGIGAVAEGGIVVVNLDTAQALGISEYELRAMAQVEVAELQRRIQAYRGTVSPPDVKDKTVIVVDDGLATGMTAAAAIRSLLLLEPRSVILAAPVGAKDAVQFLKKEATEAVCLEEPEEFTSVGQWYRDFRQLTDDEILEVLWQAQMLGLRHGGKS